MQCELPTHQKQPARTTAARVVDAMELTRRDSSMNAPSSCVRMVEQVSSVHDVGLLLQRMDIATCAAAERHTKVNCVTVAMGDVVVEHLTAGRGAPHADGGARARGGRRSMFLSVSAEKGQVRRHVCDAAFTYVTTRGPDGEKRFCPPLDDDDTSERTRWARATAKRRRALLKLAAPPPTPSNETFTFETIEVVLPKHQNHMGRTLRRGGDELDGTRRPARAARGTAACAVDAVRTQGVDGVSFNTGSNVSDHLQAVQSARDGLVR